MHNDWANKKSGTLGVCIIYFHKTPKEKSWLKSQPKSQPAVESFYLCGTELCALAAAWQIEMWLTEIDPNFFITSVHFTRSCQHSADTVSLKTNFSCFRLAKVSLNSFSL